MNFAAELESMFASGVRNVIDELRDGVRPLEFRPLESAQAGEEISAKTNARQAAGVRPADSSIQAVSGRGRIQITGQRGLIEAVVADSGFIYPLRIGSPDPVSADHLGSRMDLSDSHFDCSSGKSSTVRSCCRRNTCR